MHSDLRARDSLACDLMEAIRPQADEFVLELIRNREFRKNNFFENSDGICRILPPLTRELPRSALKWRTLIGPVADDAIASGVRLDPKKSDRLPKKESAKLTVHGLDSNFQIRSDKPEDPGEFCFPPFAALITAAARLMLALLESCVKDVGGYYAMCDTDFHCCN